MLNLLQNLTLKTKLISLVSLFVVGLSGFALLSQTTLSLAKVNGPLYQRIVQDKDLLADVLPPPLYIVETYLVANQMRDAAGTDDLKKLVEKYKLLKQDYDKRQTFWNETLGRGEIRDQLINKSRPPAEAFFATMLERYIPALERGDRTAADEVLKTVLTPKYVEHLAAIDNVVKTATVSAATNEGEVATLIARRSNFLLLTGTLVVLVGCAYAFVIGRCIFTQMKKTVGVVRSVARGDLTHRLDESSNDEFGHLAQSVNEMIASLDRSGQANREAAAQLAAIGRSQAVIEFQLDGTIVQANENFLQTVGYRLDEIQGRHHSMFVDPVDVASQQYKQFWRQLADGQFQSGEYKRFGKGGKEVWIQASYNPIFDANGKAIKVVKFAVDVTASRLKNADYQGQIAAIGKSQAVIEFHLDGTIIDANENFLQTVGYSLNEIKGKHHSQFVDAAYATSADYKQFWRQLGDGKFQAGEFKRFGKGGKEIWIQASYNPILDLNGKPFKVVKFATEITQQKLRNADYEGQIAAIGKSQAAIEFKTDGTIVTANENFLKTLGYSLADIQGKHHSMFVDPAYANSIEYKQFWRSLADGQYQAGEFKRFAKGGKEVWIQASYNPILDLNGKPFKVVKFASDISLTKQLSARMEVLINKVAENSTAVAAASEELSAVSTQMSSNAGETSAQSSVVSAASEQVSMNTQTVATGIEEMSASIKEIAKNASDAARIATSAVKMAETTNATVSKLGESSQEIGNVIKVITSIAQQTNLLALNATIEAARAGEAGKGFAVVANEVKELAKETAKATEDISEKITAIQADTTGAVEAIGQITQVINQINDISSTIASAVEEQTATTNEISRNVAEASKGTSEIAQNITSVALAAKSTTEGADNSQRAAEELSRMAAELQQLVSDFNASSDRSRQNESQGSPHRAANQ